MKYVTILLLFISCTSGYTQPLMRQQKPEVPLKELQRMEDSLSVIRMPAKRAAAKTTAGVLDTATLVSRINSCWGPGLSVAEKLDVFDTYWGAVDSFYGSFTGLPMYNWDSIVNAMRTEISAGVSRGRFAGIIGELTRYINDGHSYLLDADLYSTSALFWGRPLFYGGNGIYGACVTMLDDSVAMVYESQPGNVLNLQPGDKVLGYNGIPWKELVPLLLNHYKIPMGARPYSTDSATWHRQICAVLSNFLMFDTINIERCNGTLDNYPTTIMTSAFSGNYFCTEQLPVPGVKKMTYNDYFTNGKMVTSGVVSGTGIGYVALYDCSDISGDSLLTAVKRLVEDSAVNGLIIDIRTNFGGSLLTYYSTFHYLTDVNPIWMGWADRATPTDRYTMNPFAAPPPGYWMTDPYLGEVDMKVALLVGPGAVSAADVMQVMFRHHPNLKMIGKPTAGAFGAIVSVPLPAAGYYGARQTGDFYRAEEDDFYLSHHNFPIDSFVWFDKASTCAGKDKVLETAIKWINPWVGVSDIQHIQPSARIFPNPSAGAFSIVLQSPIEGMVEISLVSVTGAEAGRITTAVTIGENTLRADFAGSNLPAGAYQVVISGSGMETVVKKVTVLR